MVVVADADFGRDIAAIERLWRGYLAWANDELDSHYGFRLPIAELLQQDLAAIAKFGPPDGRLLLASVDGDAVGTVGLKQIRPDTVEVKRMYVEPGHQGEGIGRALLDELMIGAVAQGSRRMCLDSAIFMTSAHALYRSAGFVDIAPYPESEIPDEYKDHWVFLERSLAPE